MLKLIIFDFDGLLVNSEYVVFEALKTLLKKHNKTLAWNYFSRHIGKPVKDALKEFYKDFILPVTFSQFLRDRDIIVQQRLPTELRLMPHVKDLLRLLNKKSITLAIATSGKRTYVENYLNKFGILEYFKTVVCIDDVKRGKPHPDLILKTLEKTRFSAEESIIVEDSPSGVEAAHRAKIKSIAIPTKGVSLENFKDATLIVDSITHLYYFLKELSGS